MEDGSETLATLQRCYATANTSDVKIDSVFAIGSEEDDIYPLTTTEIAEVQKADAAYKDLFKSLIKDWKSSSLRTPCVSAKMVG